MMKTARFQEVTEQYRKLRLAVVGDFCLDRYLEIDPARAEVSIETGLAVHNVVNVRSQPGAAGTILNNLVALGIGEIYPVGFCGSDGEGYELRRALGERKGVRLDYFIESGERRTFTYCKPLVLKPGEPPLELNRLDSKNWTPTPASLQEQLIEAVRHLAGEMDAFILMDQVDLPDTGVVTTRLLAAIGELAKQRPSRLIIADSRRSLRDYPPVALKMNAVELAAMTGQPIQSDLGGVEQTALTLARNRGRPVFVTLSEHGIIGAGPEGDSIRVPALPVRGPIDIVGAGDAVTANLAAALGAGATLAEAVTIANVAASVVIHQLGTTGTATPEAIAGLMFNC